MAEKEGDGSIELVMSCDGSQMMTEINAACNRCRDSIESSFKEAGASAVKSIEDSDKKIAEILSNTEKSANSKSLSIAAIYRKQGLSQEEAAAKAWAHVNRDSASTSDKVGRHANSMSQKMKNAAKSISRSFSNTFSGINKESKNTEENVSSGFSSVSSVAKKAGAAIASAFAVKKIVDFGKSCLDLGSDLAEVQNVVDVTFPKMTSQVDEFAKSAAKSFGLSETMAKQYTGTFGAMAKAFGFSEKQAYGMGTALTSLAGDVASFYNLSQDEAYTKLKSVFTGETESLKDLG